MELIELARSLVSYRTEVPPGNEKGCARYIEDYLADLHVEGTELRLDTFGTGRANLVARLGPREPGLLLSGHMDVVPAGDDSAWTHPPFDSVVKGGRLYGRGTADMKVGLAAMLKAIESTVGRDRRRKGKSSSKGGLRRGILFVATAGEEVGFDGLKRLIGLDLIPRDAAKFGVLGEPTSLRPVRAHKGSATFKITVNGRSGHASNPQLGINAIEKVADLVDGLSEWGRKVSRIADGDLGHTIATPTMIEGGTKSNVIPGACELTVDSRWIPRHGTAFVMRGINSVLSALKKKDPDFDAHVELLYDTYSLKLSPAHPVVRLAESVTGLKSEVAPYGTEAALYTRYGIPSIALGPGDIKQAHIVDEFVPLDQARRALSIYVKMIESVCMG